MNFRSRNRRSLSKESYSGEHVRGDFRNGLAEHCIFQDMSFDNCQMGGASFFDSIFVNSEFRSCTLLMANFNGCSLRNCRFTDCNLDQARFLSATFDEVKFLGGRAEYASFESAGLKDVTFDLQLHGADMRFHGAVNVDYGDSNLWGASIKIGCKQFVGQKMSYRQVELLLGLISKSRGNDLLRHELRRFVSDESQKVIDRITLPAMAEGGV